MKQKKTTLRLVRKLSCGPQIISKQKKKSSYDEAHAIRMAEGRARDQTGNYYPYHSSFNPYD